MGVNKNHANKIIIHLLMIAKYKVFFGGMKLQFKTYKTYILHSLHIGYEKVWRRTGLKNKSFTTVYS